MPVIASGGVGKLQHLVDGIKIGRADAVLAASHLPLRRIHGARGQAFHGRQGIVDEGCVKRGGVRAMNGCDEVPCDEHGLVPVIAQDAASGRVLMVAWA